MRDNTGKKSAIGDTGTPGFAPNSIGVYVHFPWCLAKCPYCDFLSVVGERSTIPHAAYADAVIAELRFRSAELERRAPLHSVFFGGGTPSLWEPTELGRVLSTILEAFPHEPSTLEVTAECNPSSFDRDRARQLLDVGVNRFSIGIQGLDANRLRFLGRLHDRDQGLAALEVALAAGPRSVSADLIYGVAGETAQEAVDEARIIAGVGVQHLSAYTLTIEEGTRFGALARAGQLPILPEGEVADSFCGVDEALEQLGLGHYEISNFARPGYESIHNQGYWLGRDYLGLGCGAWGTIDNRGVRSRYRNCQNPERYLGWSTGDQAQDEALRGTVETVDASTALAERILLGLRLRRGLQLEKAAEELGTEPYPPSRARAVKKLTARGQLIQEDGWLRIPPSAWLFADGIISELL
ncbi:MAG: radical SAM family heme chaperone HemW [Polyangiaceae bacterium]|nr:radical SAM family heme chaperone HemW [Polyangiaceae bacterium]